VHAALEVPWFGLPGSGQGVMIAGEGWGFESRWWWEVGVFWVGSKDVKLEVKCCDARWQGFDDDGDSALIYETA